MVVSKWRLSQQLIEFTPYSWFERKINPREIEGLGGA